MSEIVNLRRAARPKAAPRQLVRRQRTGCGSGHRKPNANAPRPRVNWNAETSRAIAAKASPVPKMPDPGATSISKHSLTIAGHRTSISLEQAFWDKFGTSPAHATSRWRR